MNTYMCPFKNYKFFSLLNSKKTAKVPKGKTKKCLPYIWELVINKDEEPGSSYLNISFRWNLLESQPLNVNVIYANF